MRKKKEKRNLKFKMENFYFQGCGTAQWLTPRFPIFDSETCPDCLSCCTLSNIEKYTIIGYYRWVVTFVWWLYQLFFSIYVNCEISILGNRFQWIIGVRNSKFRLGFLLPSTSIEIDLSLVHQEITMHYDILYIRMKLPRSIQLYFITNEIK